MSGRSVCGDDVAVSVIIPAYNSARYIGECLTSVQRQTYRDFELLVIDDGSDDRTAEIAEDIAKSDSRVRVLRQENKGIAATRNIGINLASGEFIVFIDSDDVVSHDHLDSLVGGVMKYRADVAICATEQFYAEGSSKNRSYALPLGLHDAHSILRATMYYDIYPAPWGRIVRRSLYRSVSYQEGVLYEDMLPACQLIALAGRVAFVPGLYRYMMRPDSIQHREFTSDQLDKVDQALKVYREFGGWSRELDAAGRHLVVSCGFNTLSKLPRHASWNEARDRIENVIREHRARVVRDRDARLKARVACLISYFGFRLLDRLYRSFKSI